MASKIQILSLICQALLLVHLLLVGLVDEHSLALLHGLHLALLPRSCSALVHQLLLTVYATFHLTSGVHSLDVDFSLHNLAFFPCHRSAGLSLDGRKLHFFLHNLAFFPCHRSAGLSPSPNLIAIGINFPVGDAVVLGDVLAVWDLLDVFLVVLHLLAVLEGKVLILHEALGALARSGLRFALGPCSNLTVKFENICADSVGFVGTDLTESCIAALFTRSLVSNNVIEGNISAVVV